MQKIISFLLCMFLMKGTVQAQSTEDSVKAVINKMLQAMKDADAETLLQCFVDSAILQTVSETSERVSVRSEPLKNLQILFPRSLRMLRLGA